MYKITGKQKFGAVWANGECVAIFNRGVAYTNDTAKADILRAKGYTVDGEPDQVEVQADPLKKMTVDELKEYAATNGIDLGEATKKADILAAIQAAETGNDD